MNNIRISKNFTLEEFTRTSAPYPNNLDYGFYKDNIFYGVEHILQPARDAIGAPITINSGYRSILVNAYVKGNRRSQHLTGCAADITCPPDKFKELVHVLSLNPCVDQLLTAPTWCHVSWSPLRRPRNDIRLGYYS